ncbi:NHLP leader peptide domain protein [Thiorhodovibrio winogradskyi]|uniref:NHLP leader peptide domain protein n=1 Tax=Thiorhodovibrio winogradskyi TaxID=77007 RepID=A0ABZ0SAC3_9GAMM|nr:NHLP leader peptide family RiPP precursor [Thiorhodovibrio winogradskyi]
MTEAKEATEGQAAPMSRAELEAKIVARAWEDEEFHQKFLADPKAMFEDYLGSKLPASLVMTTHQEDADHLHFVIPAKPAVDLDELSDEDLERIAGGIEPVTTVVVTVSASVVSALSVSVTVAGSAAATAAGAYVWGKKT